MKKAVVLVSGGLDSATSLAMAKAQGFECYTLSFDYDQRHRSELQAAKQVSHALGATQHRVVKLGLGEIGGSALTDMSIDVPEHVESDDIPVTYVPARNTVFLAIALGYAEVVGAMDIFIGVSQIDYSHYPDCRREYIQAFQHMANLATKAGIEGAITTIHTPLLQLSKAQTVQAGVELGVDYSITVSCYQADAQGRACGDCDSCVLRKKGFAEAGLSDPTHYQAAMTV